MALYAWLLSKNRQADTASCRVGTSLWLLSCVWVLGTACAIKGAYVPVDAYSAADNPDGEYTIRPGDFIAVRVFQHDNMSAQGRVRADGHLSVPLLNAVAVAGHTPTTLAAQLQTRLAEYINAPSVTVSVEEVHPLSVSVLGEVRQPGIYALENNAGVLQALAAAGGMTAFAKKHVFVLREEKQGQPPLRILFRWEALSRAEGKAACFKLRPGDVILAE